MKIYTKTGDSGSTSLVGGSRVPKCHPRVEAYGDVDELISLLGMLRCEASSLDSPLRRVQIALMQVSAVLASPAASSKVAPLADAELSFLESSIDAMTAALPPQTAFILPGSPRASSLAHVARTVCRRAERHAVAIESRTPADEAACRYLNRLSDYLFTLARHLAHESGCADDFWLP